MADHKDFTIILPTLNEGKTVGTMLEYLFSNYKGVGVIVADDGSRDETESVVRKFAERASVTFLDRAKKGLQRGLTASIVDGIALSKTRYAIVMDADMQHPPEKVKDVMDQLASGKDLVAAARADAPGWPLYRKAISKTLMGLGKLVLFLERKESCRDIYSGFFGVDRKIFVGVVEKNRGRFVMDGYKALFDFLKCVPRGTLKIGEVPIVFGLRKFGSSKAGMKQGIAAFRSFMT